MIVLAYYDWTYFSTLSKSHVGSLVSGAWRACKRANLRDIDREMSGCLICSVISAWACDAKTQNNKTQHARLYESASNNSAFVGP